MKITFSSITHASLTTAIIASSAFALAGEGRRDSDRQRRGPPPAAFEACANALEGDVCEVKTRHGDVLAGECRIPRHHRHSANRAIDKGTADTASESTPTESDIALLCVPDHHRRPGRAETELR